MGKEIKSDKASVKSIFDKWYRIPEYQRPYVWGKDQIDELLEDVTFAQRRNRDAEYFLGSIVYQIKNAISPDGNKYEENDLLDGQQRLTTCFMIMAVGRDLAEDKDLKEICQKAIYQKGNIYDSIPERMRIVFDIRQEVKDFVDNFIKEDGGTSKENELKSIAESADDISVKNMANALLTIRAYFIAENAISLKEFFPFFRTKVLLIYVASEDLDDAFRLFTVLNDRGLKLRNSDILKANNLRAMAEVGDSKEEQRNHAKQWEELEGHLGENFDQFLSYVRTILVKEKARNSLLKEFDENIYAIKGKNTTPLLERGKKTFQLISKYAEFYDELLGGDNYKLHNSWKFDNLITVMRDTVPSDIWIPPLLAYRHYFGTNRILEFLRKLDNKFSADWIIGETPTTRIERVNAIIKETEMIGRGFSHELDLQEKNDLIDKLLDAEVFRFNNGSFVYQISQDYIYGKAFCKYLMYKLDYLYEGNDKKSSPKQISVEHILPQNPSDDSKWKRDFNDIDREIWTNRLGNLLLISRRKNSSLGRLDYGDKSKRYFDDKIELFSNSVRVLSNNKRWTKAELEANHKKVLKDLISHYGIEHEFILNSEE